MSPETEKELASELAKNHHNKFTSGLIVIWDSAQWRIDSVYSLLQGPANGRDYVYTIINDQGTTFLVDEEELTLPTPTTPKQKEELHGLL